MNRIAFIIGTYALLSFSQSALAHQSDRCAEILKFGVRDNANVLTSDQVQTSLLKTQFGGAEFSYGAISGSGEYGSTKEEKYARSYFNQTQTSTINGNILNVWSNCINNAPAAYANGHGFESYIETVNATTIRYQYRFGAPLRSQNSSAEIVSVTVWPDILAQCRNSIPKVGDILNDGSNWLQMECDIDMEKGINISVITDDTTNPIESVVVPARAKKVSISTGQTIPGNFVPLTCIASGDPDVAKGAQLLPRGNMKILHGEWDNKQCGTKSGGKSGWYLTSMGTCQTTKGSGIKGCQRVDGLLIP